MDSHDVVQSHLSRRSLLLLGSALPLAAAIPAFGPGASPAHAADAFEDLRVRWAHYLTGGPDLDLDHPQIAPQLAALSDEAAEYLATADLHPPEGASIWSDLPMVSDDAANMALTYQRMLVIATAWSTAGTDQHDSTEVQDVLVGWYRHMYTHWYNLENWRGGNWWFWEIGIPTDLGYLSILLAPVLTAEDRIAATDRIRRQAPDPNGRTGSSLRETGGNRADKVLACILRGVVARHEEDITLARDALSDVEGDGARSLFQYVSSGNGFYPDGSYIDHEFLPYVGTYGNVALTGVARSLMLLAGSPWEVTDPDVAVILDAPEKSFSPFIWSGRMMETVRGRAVSREHERDYHDAWSTANAVMLLATQIEEPYRSTYRSLAKGWLTRCSEDYSAAASLSDLSRALPLLADQEVPAAAEGTGHVQFGSQERMVHRGEGWAYTVATSSTRIGRYEWGNNENNLGWHQGDGAAYLHLAHDQGQFADDYWPTVDPYRLPGTTASLTERESGESGAGTGIPRAENRWAGGVGLSDRWGTAGMDLTNSPGTVEAKKSWFLLDDMVIALGSGVSADGDDAETIVENRSFALGHPGRLTVGGRTITTTNYRRTPGWAHLEDVAGYVFLGEQQVRAEVADRSGSWQEINSGADTGGSTEEVARSYATLSVQHPAGTTGGRYGYVILPGRSAQQTRAAVRILDIEVVRQDEVAHIVRVHQSDRWFLFAHLFAAAAEGSVRASGPCAVLASGTGNTATIAVSSPSKSLEQASIELDLGRPFRQVTAQHERLAVTGGHQIAIEADFAHAAGASFETELRV